MPSRPLPGTGSGSASRAFLLGTAATTGAAILVIEILGARMLAPFLGTSHFVWTAQIAVTLVALAAGYYGGGWLADRAPRPGSIYSCVALAAVFLCISTLFIEPVAYACLRFRLALGSLLASAFLFFIPLALLATVGPLVIRLLTTSVETVGTSVGVLTAISTVGSFAGTVLVGYVFIPWFSNSTTMFGTAAVLLLLCAAHLLLNRPAGRGTTATTAVATLMVLGLVTFDRLVTRRPHWSHVRELYAGNSNFGQLQVLETLDGRRRFYLNDYLMQNTYDTVTRQSTSMFTYMLHQLSHAYAPAVSNALCIGVGIGIVPSLLAAENVRVDAVEINPAVLPVARDYFHFDSSKVQVTVADGRQFVNATTNRYDTIIVDAFLGDSSPAHLMSREAFTAMQRALAPGGVVVMNVFGDFQLGRDFFIGSIHKTLRSVFRSVVLHAAGNGNVFAVASDQPELRIRRGPFTESVHPYARDQVADAFNRTPVPDPRAGVVLTDDYNPLDFHDATNREALRRQFAINLQSY